MSKSVTQSRNLELIGIALIAAIIVVILPLTLDIFRLNLVGKYLTYAFVAVGLVLCWGYTGILSLGQGVFFGLGGYCMAMFLKLEASSVANTKIQSTPGIPDFMDWNQLHALPFFWVPFKSLPFALVAVIAVPTIAGLHRRRGDVQAAGRRCLLRHHHAGARCGDDHPDRRPARLYRRHQRHHRPAHLAGLGYPHRHAKYILYFVCCALLLGTMFMARFVLASKLGRILRGHARPGGSRSVLRLRRRQLQDLRVLPGLGDGGSRWRDVHASGRIHVAVLRRHRAVDRDGHLLRRRRPPLHRRRGRRNATRQLGQDHVFGDFPQLWLFAMGGLFIAVVVAFPRGLAGVMTDQIMPNLGSWKKLGS